MGSVRWGGKSWKVTNIVSDIQVEQEACLKPVKPEDDVILANHTGWIAFMNHRLYWNGPSVAVVVL